MAVQSAELGRSEISQSVVRLARLDRASSTILRADPVEARMAMNFTLRDNPALGDRDASGRFDGCGSVRRPRRFVPAPADLGSSS